jgi:hypothetical protein
MPFVESTPIILSEEDKLNNIIQSTREAFEMSGISTRPYNQNQTPTGEIVSQLAKMTVESPEYRRNAPTHDPTIFKILSTSTFDQVPYVLSRIDDGTVDNTVHYPD